MAPPGGRGGFYIMPLLTDTAGTTELVTLAQAKTHLRVAGGESDLEIDRLIKSARNWAEGYCGRTLQPSVVRTENYPDWPKGTVGKPIILPRPPCTAVGSVKYYDTDDTDTTLATTKYHTIFPADSNGLIVWDDTMDFPSLSIRPDAVRVAFTSGYTQANCPAAIRQAMLLRLTVEWGQDDERQLMAADMRARGILDQFGGHVYQ